MNAELFNYIFVDWALDLHPFIQGILYITYTFWIVTASILSIWISFPIIRENFFRIIKTDIDFTVYSFCKFALIIAPKVIADNEPVFKVWVVKSWITKKGTYIGLVVPRLLRFIWRKHEANNLS